MPARLRLLLFVLLLPMPLRAQGALTYKLEYSAPGSANLRVAIELAEPSAGERTLVMPRAVPMGYGEQPYDRFLHNVSAYASSGEALAVERQDGPRWKLGAAGAHVARIEYEVNLAQMEREILSGGDSSRARPDYLELLGYSVLGFVEGLEDKAIRVHIAGPKDWPVFSTLAPKTPAASESLSVAAQNYYALADSQILMGHRAALRRIENKVPLFLALYSEGEADAALLGRLCGEAFQRVADYFGSVPFAHFTIVFEHLKPLSERHSYAFGMEHLESSSFSQSSEQALTVQTSQRQLAQTKYWIAHHIAHSWIPKRSYGQGYFPFRWELAALIDTIWLSEGFAQYAAIDALADGMPTKEGAAFRESMIESRFRSTLRRMPAFLKQMPLVELSKIASTRYSEDFRTGRTVFSRGGLMAAEMDQRMREKTKGKKRLRDALRYLVEWSAREKRAFRIEELPRIFKEATRVETRDILEKWLKPMKD